MVDSGSVNALIEMFADINTRPSRAERVRLRCTFWIVIIAFVALFFVIWVAVGMFTPGDRSGSLVIAAMLYFLLLFGAFGAWHAVRERIRRRKDGTALATDADDAGGADDAG